jgi:hypothetical protein
MKFTAALLALFGSAAAFAPSSVNQRSTALNAGTLNVEDLPGITQPFGYFDPLSLAEKADSNTFKRYREAEVTHGRVSMLAVVGFLVGENVAGSSLLFDGQVSGPAVTHLEQISPFFWILLTIAIGGAEVRRAKTGWVDPVDVPVGQAGLLRGDYFPGDIGFDPFGLKPTDPEALKLMHTKELNNGRLAMIGASGFMAQELVNGKGIFESFADFQPTYISTS